MINYQMNAVSFKYAFRERRDHCEFEGELERILKGG